MYAPPPSTGFVIYPYRFLRTLRRPPANPPARPAVISYVRRRALCQHFRVFYCGYKRVSPSEPLSNNTGPLCWLKNKSNFPLFRSVDTYNTCIRVRACTEEGSSSDIIIKMIVGLNRKKNHDYLETALMIRNQMFYSSWRYVPESF